ncbi:MAG TPA: hypothetical protein VLQ48_00100 [Chloroflexia bacterium]|nr:hypothetical protein [Chloroflexia bacterium]
MMIRRKKYQSQAAPLVRRNKQPGSRKSALSVVPRGVAGAAGAAGKLRPQLPRWIDPHPGIAVLVACAIIAAVCFLYLSQVTNVSNANYRLQDLKTQHAQLQRDQDSLRLQIANAQSLTTIANRATKQLNMVQLDGHYTYLPLADGPLAALPMTATSVISDK